MINGLFFFGRAAKVNLSERIVLCEEENLITCTYIFMAVQWMLGNKLRRTYNSWLTRTDIPPSTTSLTGNKSEYSNARNLLHTQAMYMQNVYSRVWIVLDTRDLWKCLWMALHSQPANGH